MTRRPEKDNPKILDAWERLQAITDRLQREALVDLEGQAAALMASGYRAEELTIVDYGNGRREVRPIKEIP